MPVSNCHKMTAYRRANTFVNAQQSVRQAVLIL